jgi:small conductance mechanosensitive channel
MFAAATHALAAASAPTASVGSSIADWFEAHATAIVTSAIIVVAAVVLNFVVRRAIRLAIERLVKANVARRERAERDEQTGPSSALQQQTVERLRSLALQSERSEQRARTVGSLLRYVATITIYTVAALMVLAEFGVSIAPLIAGAGIVGVALGFGAQSLVKDFLSGIFMLMEDQYGVGDVVDLGEATGTVERVTLRVTTVRGLDGTVWYVPNGEIRRVGNKSQAWSRIVLDIEVAYETDIARASEVIKRTADEVWKAQTSGATVIEEPELWGVENIAPNAIVLRLAVKTRPGEQLAVGRALRARLKEAFDEAGIATPIPQQTVWFQGGASPRGDDGGPT